MYHIVVMGQIFYEQKKCYRTPDQCMSTSFFGISLQFICTHHYIIITL